LALKGRLPRVRRLDLLDGLVPALVSIGGLEPALSERECAAFAARDWLRGRQLRSPAAGRAGGLRPDGALLVDLGAGTIGGREGHVELALPLRPRATRARRIPPDHRGGAAAAPPDSAAP